MTGTNLTPKASAILALLREGACKEYELFYAGNTTGGHDLALDELRVAGYVVQSHRPRYGERTYTLVGDVSCAAVATAVANARRSIA